MTGGGGGYCLLKIPRTPDAPITGFAGLYGTPVSLLCGSPRMDIAPLHVRAQRIQLALRGIERRIAILETVRQEITDAYHKAHGGNPTRRPDEGVS